MGRSRTVHELNKFVRLLCIRFIKDHTVDLAATMAFYFLLSLFPLIIFLFAIIPYLGLTPDQLLSVLMRFLPPEIITLIRQNFDAVFTKNGGLLSLGVIATLWPASNAVNALMRTLNRAYRVDETRPFYETRILALSFTVVLVFAIAMTLAVNVVSAALARSLFYRLGLSETFADVWSVVSTVVSFLVIIVIFAFFYRFGPNMKLSLHETMIGAVVAGVGWQMASFAFSIYVRYFRNFSATYGTLGGIIILMLWFYLTAITIIIGGQVNAILHHLHAPDRHK